MPKTLYIDRSTGESRNGDWIERLDLADVGRIVVGTGPGSFAGIRSALAFAQGFALGRPGVEVKGLPSACALARSGERLAVVGDARQGKAWIAPFEGLRQLGEIRQVDQSALAGEVPDGFVVVSPDDRRIGAVLRGVFAARYLGERLPNAEGLKAFAEACPSALTDEPLPIYLNPAVRS